MTGYAVTSRDGPAGTVTIEIKSVNSRFLDLQFRINDDLRSFEPVLREALMARLNRGKVECRLSFGRAAAAAGSQSLNGGLLESLAAMQQEVRQRLPEAAPLTVAEVLRWPGIIEDANAGQDSLQGDVAAAMQEALEAFLESRRREGAAMQAMLLSRVDELEAIVARITPLVPQAITQFQQRAIDRLEEALTLAAQASGGATPISRDDAMERIRQEVTMYGIRIDLAEELSRLSAHLAETRAILKKGGQVGKRLDFMMQELNREANTVGSKAALKELSDASMAMKLLIEQMREQVQNLE
ncbi:TIGR00255 family protein [Noviherbaspirillum humi]|uniref:TIGR00255 family protein n=1 Tax=Noviherbaspirillum humi TaxID=1688639 RepID=A0A239D659_9BURK|nr:YicC/YloC family endoribonuclease [Noviherbaspirillum humi]SNS27767.1 TIGR00255 family protein [Noviherbaspirillum humi]